MRLFNRMASLATALLIGAGIAPAPARREGDGPPALSPWSLFRGQHKNPEANNRRQMKRRYGARQVKRALKSAARGDYYPLTEKVRR